MSKSLLKEMLNSLINEDKATASEKLHEYLTLKAKGVTVKEDASHGIYPGSIGEVRSLVRAFKTPMTAMQARDSISHLMYSDDLDAQLAEIDKTDPTSDVRPLLADHLNEIIGNSDLDQDSDMFKLLHDKILSKY